MTAPTLPLLSLQDSNLPRLPSPESLVLALDALGLGAWTAREGGGSFYAKLTQGSVLVEVVGSASGTPNRPMIRMVLVISGPGFRGVYLGANSAGQELMRILPPIPWTDAAAGDVLRTLERFKLPALVAALEVP